MTPQATKGLPNTYGFDANQVISGSTARAFVARGYTFVLRYLPRIKFGASDLSATEVNTLLDAGLSVMAVQHVESAESWTPTLAKGSLYGTVCANMARAAGFIAGCTVWLDLEGVAEGTPAQDVADYCREWYHCVAAAGFQPGLYVGWHCGLNAHELYLLPFQLYWSAYNLDGDEYPAVRGVCMKQSSESQATQAILHTDFDVDTIFGDKLGGFPTLLSLPRP